MHLCQIAEVKCSLDINEVVICTSEKSETCHNNYQADLHLVRQSLLQLANRLFGVSAYMHRMV